MSDPATDAITTADDPIREQLLAAAARVFAEKGYAGTKIMHIIRESGLSSGAVYGRFDSKKDLLVEAVVSRSLQDATGRLDDVEHVAEVVVRAAVDRQGPLSDGEAIQLEAYVAARQEPEVAAAITEARRRWREAAEPLVDAAHDEGLLDTDADIESIMYFLQTMRLGLLVQRGAGVAPPDPDRWQAFVTALVASLPGVTPTSTD